MSCSGPSVHLTGLWWLHKLIQQIACVTHALPSYCFEKLDVSLSLADVGWLQVSDNIVGYDWRHDGIWLKIMQIGCIAFKARWKIMFGLLHNECANLCSSNGPVLFHWSGLVRPGLIGLFTCGWRKRMARSGPTGSGRWKRTGPMVVMVIVVVVVVAAAAAVCIW